MLDAAIDHVSFAGCHLLSRLQRLLQSTCLLPIMSALGYVRLQLIHTVIKCVCMSIACKQIIVTIAASETCMQPEIISSFGMLFVKRVRVMSRACRKALQGRHGTSLFNPQMKRLPSRVCCSLIRPVCPTSPVHAIQRARAVAA